VQDGEYVITTAWGERQNMDFSSTPLGSCRRLVLSMAVGYRRSQTYRANLTRECIVSCLAGVIEGSECDLHEGSAKSYLLINSAGANAVGKPVAEIIGQR